MNDGLGHQSGAVISRLVKVEGAEAYTGPCFFESLFEMILLALKVSFIYGSVRHESRPSECPRVAAAMEAHHKFLQDIQTSVKVHIKQVLCQTSHPTLESQRRIQLHCKKTRLQSVRSISFLT
jgi:hypothetical protein